MTETVDVAPPTAGAPEGERARADDVSGFAALGLLVDEARDTVERELDFWSSAALAARIAGQRVLVAVACIAVLVFVTLTTLAMGALLVLSPHLGAAGATLAIVSATVAAMAIALLLARREIRAFGGALARRDEVSDAQSE